MSHTAPGNADTIERLPWSFQHNVPPVRKFHEDLIRKKFGARAEGILRAPTNEEVKEVTELLTALKLEQDAN